MIGVIIYNPNKYIEKTLLSICLQDSNITTFVTEKLPLELEQKWQKRLNIIYLDLKNNCKISTYTKKIAMLNIDYITFINSGDIFYNIYSLEILLQGIKNTNYDIIVGSFWNKNGIDCVSNKQKGLFGKMFKKEFIKYIDIAINSNNMEIENAIIKRNPSTNYISDCIYVYNNLK